MIYEINQTNNKTTTQTIDSDINIALSLINAVKKQDVQITQKQIDNLLIEYILAKMAGNNSEAEAIQGQMTKVMQTYEQNMQRSSELIDKLKAMETNPGVHLSKDLAYLRDLMAALQQDVASGDMSNLSQYL